MIIRHIPMKSIKKSKFTHLVRYITHGQGKQERVGEIRISNCSSLEPAWAGLEVEATQNRNKRAQGDKSYHLLISFAKGESPEPEVLRAIEERVVASVGFSEHQRISAVHHDTDNLHIHIAINKIHPVHFTMIEPYQAYKKFSLVAEQLEADFSLIKTNHQCKKSRAENRADDMEHHAGIESLINWVKRNCLEQLKQCHNWPSFHNTLAEHGLTMRLRGNGFILDSGSGICVKASSLSRNFSKNKLEERLGLFQPGTIEEVSKSQSYILKPLHQGTKTKELYDQYLVERENNKKMMKEKLLILRAKKNRLIEQAKIKGRLKRAAVKMIKSGRDNKKRLYESISKSLKDEIQQVMQHYRQDCEYQVARYRGRTWADWLQKKALDGNEDALMLMRYRNQKNNIQYSLSGHTHKNSQEQSNTIDSITKEGTVIYKISACAIRDNGREISISRGASVEGLKEAVMLAKKQFGDCIAVNGSELFKKTILMVAVRYKLDIRFDDSSLEIQRQNLLTTEGNKNEQSRRSGIVHGGTVGRSHEVVTTTHRSSRYPTKPGYNNHTNRTRTKSNIGHFRPCSPSENKNSLRSLSELPMVQFTRRGEVLLQNHAHDKLERKGTQFDNPMRRPISSIEKMGKGKKR